MPRSEGGPGHCFRNFGVMGKRKLTEENAAEIDKVVAWALWKSKTKVSNIAQQFSICEATVYNWVNRVEKLVAEKIDMEKLHNAVLLCFPAALQSLAHNLSVEKDASVTNNFLNKTVFRDIKESESRSETNIYNLGAGANPSLRQLDHGRIKAVAERLRQRIGEAEKSPVVLRDEVSPDD